MRRLIGIALAAALAVMVASAPAEAQDPSPGAMAAAKELIEASRAAEKFSSVLPLIMQQLKPMIAQGRPQVERDLDIMMPMMMDLAQQQLGKVSDDLAKIYVSNFSVDEMRQLTAFYRSPVGQKFFEKYPVIIQQSMAVGQKLGEALMKELQSRMIEELRKRGHNI